MESYLIALALIIISLLNYYQAGKRRERTKVDYIKFAGAILLALIIVVRRMFFAD